MQEKKSTDVKEILLRLAGYTNTKGIKGLAEFLGLSENRLYAWIGRGRVGNTGVILAKLPNIRLEWLKTGTEPMFVEEVEQQKSSSLWDSWKTGASPKIIIVGESPSDAGVPREFFLERLPLRLSNLQMKWIETGLRMGDIEMLHWLIEIRKKKSSENP